jgi:hypothetical protein
MSRTTLPVALAALAMLGWGAVHAQIADATSEDGEQPVRVYTNADLEKLPPLPVQQGQPPSAEEVERRWAFVQSVLDQAYDRVDAARSHELERRRTEAEADALEQLTSRPRYLLPLPYGYRFGDWPPHPERPREPGAEPSRLWERPNAHLFRPITPIHARPYQTNLFRLEARQPGPAAPPPGRPPKTGGHGKR